MTTEEIYELNTILNLERENSKLKLQLKKKERRIKLLEAKLRNQKNTKCTDNLGGDDLDLIAILER